MCLLSYLPGGTLLYTSARPYPPFRVCRPIRRTSFPDPPRSERGGSRCDVRLIGRDTEKGDTRVMVIWDSPPFADSSEHTSLLSLFRSLRAATPAAKGGASQPPSWHTRASTYSK